MTWSKSSRDTIVGATPTRQHPMDPTFNPWATRSRGVPRFKIQRPKLASRKGCVFPHFWDMILSETPDMNHFWFGHGMSETQVFVNCINPPLQIWAWKKKVECFETGPLDTQWCLYFNPFSRSPFLFDPLSRDIRSKKTSDYICTLG